MKGIIYLTLGTILFLQRENVAAVRETCEDTLLTVLTYGLTIQRVSATENLVAKKYGFRYYSVGGCVNPPELEDSVKRVNNIAYGVLEKRHGKGWHDCYIEEVNKLLDYMEKAEALVEKEPYIIQKRRELKAQQKGHELYLDVIPTSLDGRQIQVSAYTLNDNTQTSYFEMEVDAVAQKVKLLSQKL